MEGIFTNAYEANIWGNNNNTEYSGSSGGGSFIDYNKDTFIPFLKNFIVSYKIKNIVDLGCGDFQCGNMLYDDLDVFYTGYDAYKKVIDYNSKKQPFPKYSFKHLDFCNNKESIVNGELCILKDVIQHWSIGNIYSFLDYLIEHKKFKYILICNCCNQRQDNTDIRDGDFRHLSCDYLPLKKYHPIKMFNYHSKEVSVIVSYKYKDYHALLERFVELEEFFAEKEQFLYKRYTDKEETWLQEKKELEIQIQELIMTVNKNKLNEDTWLQENNELEIQIQELMMTINKNTSNDTESDANIVYHVEEIDSESIPDTDDVDDVDDSVDDVDDVDESVDDVFKSVSEPVVKSVPESVSKSVVKSVPESVPESVVKSVPESVPESVSESVADVEKIDSDITDVESQV
jgi:hypothetical protein